MMLPEIPPKYIYLVLGFIGTVFVANVLLLDFFIVGQRNNLADFQTKLGQLSENFRILGGRLYDATGGQIATPSAGTTTPISLLNPVNNAVCPTSCVDLIALSTEAGRVSTRSLINAPYAPVTTTVSSKGEYFVPLGSGSISSTGTTWTDIGSAQASFDAGNYSSIKAAYFEAILRTQSGEVHARLFDTTTPAILWGSDVSTQSNASTFLSGQITLSPGQKTYRVQMYSTIAPGYLDQARVRIVTQ